MKSKSEFIELSRQYLKDLLKFFILIFNNFNLLVSGLLLGGYLFKGRCVHSFVKVLML